MQDQTRLASFVVVAMLIGCAPTGYHLLSFSGGYDDADLSGGRYSVTFKGNGYTNHNTALKYAYRRAGELCPAGFDVLSGEDATSTSYVVTHSQYVSTVNAVDKPEVRLVIQCRLEAAKPAPAPTAAHSPGLRLATPDGQGSEAQARLDSARAKDHAAALRLLQALRQDRTRACDAHDTVTCAAATRDSERMETDLSCWAADVAACDALCEAIEPGMPGPSGLPSTFRAGLSIDACLTLGTIYSNGEGVATSNRSAAAKFDRACVLGAEFACGLRDRARVEAGKRGE